MGIHELYGGLRQSDVEGLIAALAGKAADASVVHRAGAETVDGAKTFTVAPQVPVGHLLTHPVRRDDARLADARTPTAHADTHAVGGADPVAAGDIGAAETVHAHTAADITDGVFALARLPVGAGGQQVARGNDVRFVPGGGAAGQVLTKASGTDHVLAWTDPAGSGEGGTYIAGTVPAGAATVTITHNLGTRDVVVMVRETAGYQYVPVANDAPTVDTVRLVFAAAPAAGQYRYVVFAALGEPVQGPVAPTSHAPTHAAGGADPLSPAAIGAAESEHTHSASEVSSGTLNLARLPTGTSGSTVALGNHTHSQYAATGHTHPVAAPAAHAASHHTGGGDELEPGDIGAAEAVHAHTAGQILSGTFSASRLPVGSGPSQVAAGDHTHSPVLRGPWTQTSGFVSTNLAYIGTGRDTGGQLTVPALGYDWMPLAAGQYAVRSDVLDTVPTLELTVDDPLGVVCARGFGYGSGRDMGWRPVPLSPVLGVVLSGSSSHTFYLWMRAGALGGWTESSNTGDPHITVYALPMEAWS